MREKGSGEGARARGAAGPGTGTGGAPGAGGASTGGASGGGVRRRSVSGTAAGRPGSRRGERRFLVAVVLVLLAWRAFVCLGFVPWWEARANVAPAPDAYPALARSLLERHELGYLDQGASPTTIRTPVFPGWLALGMLLGGDEPHRLALWASLVPIAAGAWLALAARRRWGTLAGWTAAAVAVLHPLPTLVTGRVMSDEFAGALGMLGLLAWVTAGERREGAGRAAPGWAFAAGLLLGAHALARPSGLLTLAAWGLVVALRERARWREALAVLLLALVPAAAWSVRSSRLEGRPVIVSSLTFYNFWLGEARDRLGPETRRGEHFLEKTRMILEAGGMAHRDPRGFWYGQLTPREIARMEPALRAAALDRIRRDPAGYLARFVRGLGLFWVGAETVTRQRQYLLAVPPVLLLALLGALAGWRRDRFRRDPLAALALATIVLHWLAFAAIVPFARYSVAVYPHLAWLAAAGVGWLVAGRGFGELGARRA